MAQSDFSFLDNPPESFIDDVRARYPTERETDALLTRKLHRRAGPPYKRIGLAELTACLERMLGEKLGTDFVISGQSWFTGGVSKIQMGFTLEWTDPARGRRRERMVIRMDPSESMNTTSRAREFELLQAFQGVIPVPQVFWIDADARWFPEPALIYAFAAGVTKPSNAVTGKVSGLGTVFGPELRAKLAPQFLRHLAAIHTFDPAGAQFATMERPEPNSVQGALWQLNRARRTWEEDRGEDVPLMEVAANWLERNLPKLDHVSVVHGDFRSGNFLFDEQSGEINAWLDWERGHLGDRHRDLAWTTQLTMGHYADDGKTYLVCGLIPLDEFYDRYTEASGLSVDPERLAFYKVLNSYQIIVSVTASAYRVVRLGLSHQDVLLARVKGMAPMAMKELAAFLQERV